MARSTAYRAFLDGYSELQALLVLGRASSLAPEAEAALARAVVVLVAGHLEAFFNSLVTEVLGSMGGEWDKLSRAQRTYAARRLHHEMKERLEAIPETYPEARNIDALIQGIKEISRAIEDPRQIPAPADKLEGFYQDLAPASIEKLLKKLHPEEKSFLGFVEGRGLDRSRICTVLQQLVNNRTEIAHGGFSSRPSLADARLYTVTATAIARHADVFLREVFPLGE